MHDTHVYRNVVHKGSQSVLFVATLVINLAYNGGVHAALFREWSSTCQYRVTRG
jgi:hypothetical protein